MLLVKDTDYNGHIALFMYDELDDRIGSRDTLEVITEGCQFHPGQVDTNGPVPAIGMLTTPNGGSLWVFPDWSLRTSNLTAEQQAEVNAETRGF